MDGRLRQVGPRCQLTQRSRAPDVRKDFQQFEGTLN
jgi:hypothetical protein